MKIEHQMSSRPLPTARGSTICQSISMTSVQLSSDNLRNRSFLLKRIRGQPNSRLIPRDTIRLVNTHHPPDYQKTSQFPFGQLTNKEQKFDEYSSNNKSHRIKMDFSSRSTRAKKHSFNSVAYCIAYCTTIIIGTTVGGWIGGLFEFLFGGHNGCNNTYRGHFNCHIKYSSVNITTHCINIFYKESIPNDSPYICLCRFRNQSKGKYRDCEFLHARIE